MSGDRRLPIVEAPVALASPHVARLLVTTWERAVVPALRASGEAIPAPLADFVEACRHIASPPTSDCGSSLDEGAEVGAASPHGQRLTTRQVAERLALTDRQVRALCASGALRAAKFGGAWMVDPASIEDRSARRAAAG